jgi:hypothetical protein
VDEIEQEFWQEKRKTKMLLLKLLFVFCNFFAPGYSQHLFKQMKYPAKIWPQFVYKTITDPVASK